MLVISGLGQPLVQAAAQWVSNRRWGLTLRYDGGYSGVIAGTPSYQQGKVLRLAQWQQAS
jgi:phosphoserine phosphatase